MIYSFIFFFLALWMLEWHDKCAKSTWKKGWLWIKDLKFLNASNKYVDRKDPEFPNCGWRRKYKYELRNGKWNLILNKRPAWLYLWIFEPKYHERFLYSSTFLSSLATGEKFFQRNFHACIAIALCFINFNYVYLYIGAIYGGGAVKEALKKYNLFVE